MNEPVDRKNAMTTPTTTTSPNNQKNFWLAALCLAGVIAAYHAVHEPSEDTDSTPAYSSASTDTSYSSASRRCESAVRTRLKSPSSATFSQEDGGSYADGTIIMSGTVIAENSFGADTRIEWLCSIEGTDVNVSFL